MFQSQHALQIVIDNTNNHLLNLEMNMKKLASLEIKMQLQEDTFGMELCRDSRKQLEGEFSEFACHFEEMRDSLHDLTDGGRTRLILLELTQMGLDRMKVLVQKCQTTTLPTQLRHHHDLEEEHRLRARLNAAIIRGLKIKTRKWTKKLKRPSN